MKEFVSFSAQPVAQQEIDFLILVIVMQNSATLRRGYYIGIDYISRIAAMHISSFKSG